MISRQEQIAMLDSLLASEKNEMEKAKRMRWKKILFTPLEGW